MNPNNNNPKYNQMSRSSRQIAVPRQLPRQASTLSTYTHRRNGSVQSKNFTQLLQLGRKHYHQNQLPQTIDILTRGLYYQPNHLEINYLLGVSHLSLEHISDAIKYLNVVVKNNSGFKRQIWLLLGIAYRKGNQLDASVRAVSKYLENNSNDAEGLFFRAKVYCKMEQYGQAIQDLDKVIQAKPKHIASVVLKAKCQIAEGNCFQALQTLKKGKAQIEQVQALQQLLTQEARVYLRLKQYTQALKLFDNWQQKFPTIKPQSNLLKAKIYQQSGRNQQAMMLFNQLLGKNSSTKVFSQAIAQASINCMRQRDFYQAFAYLKRSPMMNVKSKPTDQLLRLAEGMTFLMKKKYAQAIVLMGSCQLTFNHELQFHSVFLVNLLNNALAFGNFSLGNHKIALELYQKIIPDERSTDMTAASYNICICEGIIEYQKDHKDESLNLFEKGASFILRPQPFFYMAVIMNEEYLKQPINTQGFVRILELIERGLRAGQNAHMYYYRAVLYLYLGMNNQALEDIDRAIQKSQDNVARYFHARGVIFFLDKNYEQAIMEFGTALSIDQNDEQSLIEKAKCELLQGDQEAAYKTIQSVERADQLILLFLLHQKQYTRVMEGNPNEAIEQVCCFMQGKFQSSGPSGKLMLAILYQNYEQVVGLIDQASTLGVSIGCLQINDLLILKGFCEYRLGRFEECLLSLGRVESYLKQTSARSQTYSEQDQRKLLQCRVNIILLNFKRGHQLESLSLTEQLLGQVCEGPIYDQLFKLKQFLSETNGLFSIQFGFNSPMLSDYFAEEEHQGLTFKYLIPMPNYRVSQVEYPQYQQLLTNFTTKDIENRPEAPWIKRGEYGLIFTNEVREFQNLNLKTQENEGVRSRMPTNEQSRALSKKRSQLIQQLKLSTSVLDKLERIAQKKQKNQQK